MGISKLKIPKVCEYCGKAFEARTFNTRFCSDACGVRKLRQREYDNADLYSDTETAQAVKDWKPKQSAKALVIGHDPRLQKSNTIADYALFADYYFQS